MAAAFGTEVVAESYYREQVDDILKHYTAAEVAAAGIFSSKFLEHKALSDLGIWCSSTENYYYRRIYHMVAEKIMPKIWVVAKLMLRSPQTAIHWGSYLMKVCEVQQTGDVAVNLQKSDVRERQFAVGHNAFELHTQALRIIADFHQVTWPKCLAISPSRT